MSAETIQAGTYLVEAPCPRCGALEEILATVTTALTTPLDGTPSLKVKLSSKARDHDCQQRRIPETTATLEGLES